MDMQEVNQPLGYIKPQQEEIYFVGKTDKKVGAKKSLPKSSEDEQIPSPSMVICLKLCKNYTIV